MLGMKDNVPKDIPLILVLLLVQLIQSEIRCTIHVT